MSPHLRFTHSLGYKTHRKSKTLGTVATKPFEMVGMYLHESTVYQFHSIYHFR
jgi:hypothetical protein